MKQGMGYLVLVATLLWSLFATVAVYADEIPSEEVRQTVAKSVAELVQQFDQERPYYSTDPERFYKNMEGALSKIVDFRRIAARVMGKYGKSASKEQKDKFVEVFKRSLYETYSKTLIESGTFKINVTSAKINSRSDGRANVDLEVISDNGSVYPVVYAMYLAEGNKWLLENVIVFGVNVGLAFKDRFETQVRSHNGDIDKVISSWSGELDIKKPEEG